MFSLFLDQSFGEGVIALFRNGHVVEVLHREMKESRHPCALFENLLDRHGLHLDDISFLVCGVGPGSYTGIRSAAATMKAISFVTLQPIVASSSLSLYAPAETGDYLIAADAGIGGVFVQEIAITEGAFHVSCPERLEIEEFLTKVASGAKVVVKSRDWLTNKGLDTSVVFKEVPSHVSMVAKIAYRDFEAGRYFTEASLPLLYLRKTQAEIDRQSVP